jgi:hypothetical protein
MTTTNQKTAWDKTIAARKAVHDARVAVHAEFKALNREAQQTRWAPGVALLRNLADILDETGDRLENDLRQAAKAYGKTLPATGKKG